MQLHKAIESALARSAIATLPVDADRVTDEERASCVRSVILADANGQVQVLIAADSLLDLAALCRFTGRELNAPPEDARPAANAPADGDTPPLFPGALDLPLVADRRLLARDSLLLGGGDPRTLLRLPADAFRRLLDDAGAASADFSVPLQDLPAEPSDVEGDAAEIGNAVAKFTTRRIQKRLEDTLDFPPLPEVAHRIIQIGADPYASVKELAAVVEIDPALSAQVVSWASSPYYAAPGKIRSIQDAIVRVLGFDLVMNLALGLALGKTLRLPRDGRYGYRNYWVQAVHCAAMVEGLGRAMPSGLRPPGGLAYLGGLLHNFGFIVLAELFKPQLQLVCRYAEANPHLGHGPVERFLMGITREQIVAWLMRSWHIPEEVCTALRYQHEPERAGEHEILAALLHLATRVMRQQGLGSASDQRIPDALFARLGLDRDDADAVADRIRHSGQDLQALARDLAA